MSLKNNSGGKKIKRIWGISRCQFITTRQHICFCFSIFSSLDRLFEKPETRAMMQDKPTSAGNTQNSSDPRSSPGSLSCSVWFIWRERHINEQESRQTDSDSTRGDSSLQKHNNSWRRGHKTSGQYSQFFGTGCSVAFHYSKVLYLTHLTSLQRHTCVLVNMSLWQS